jgi:biopolymer transport protein TolR
MAKNNISRRTRQRGQPRAAFSEINVTPFVDVMLVLLVVFMITAPMMTSGVSVDLPQSKASALPGNDEPLNVSIKKDGSVYIQNSPSEITDLGPKLQAILGEKIETRIFVRADRSIDYGQVMRVIGEITSAGFSKVALVTGAKKSRRRR